jgi:hypothetical protein
VQSVVAQTYEVVGNSTVLVTIQDQESGNLEAIVGTAVVSGSADVDRNLVIAV